MNPSDQSNSYGIVIRRIRRKASAFGASALELMLVITFLITLMLLAWTLSQVQRENAHVLPSHERPNDQPESMEDLVKRLQTEVKSLQAERDSALDERASALDERASKVAKLHFALAEKDAEIEELRAQLNDEQAQLNREQARNGNSDSQGAEEGHNWPPIIRLEEADGYVFKTNSSAISSDFENLLRNDVVERILEIAFEFNAYTVDIVGHTDERPVTGWSNLDEELVDFLNGAPAGLTAADNAGLGFARAAAVARVLSGIAALEHFRVTPMSGAQVILRSGSVSDGSEDGDVPSRRRIEIRMRGDDRES